MMMTTMMMMMMVVMLMMLFKVIIMMKDDNEPSIKPTDGAIGEVASPRSRGAWRVERGVD